MILIIVLLPTTDLLITTQRAGSSQRMAAEATDIASSELEDIERMAGVDKFTPPSNSNPHIATNPTDLNYNPTLPTTLGSDQFTTVYSVEPSYQNGGLTTSLCSSPANSGPTQNYYLITSTVYEGNDVISGNQVVQAGNGNAPIQVSQLSTVLALASSTPVTDGEVAVPVLNPLTSQPDTTDDVWMSLVGVWAGTGSAPAVPGGETTTPSNTDTGTSGCAVFKGLDAAPGWEYEAAIVYCGGALTTNCTSAKIVDFDESSDNANAPETPHIATIVASPGSVIVSDPFYLGEGSTAAVNLISESCGASTGTCAAYTPAQLPVAARVTVSNTHLQCEAGQSVCLLGNGSSTVATGASTNLLLFPYPDGYTAWAGDSPEASPLSTGTAGAQYPVYPTPLSIQTTANATAVTTPSNGAIYLYPLTLKITYVSTVVTGVTLTSVDGGNDSYTFSKPSTCTASPCSMPVAVPLGEYTVSVNGATALTAGSKWIWVTPTGTCAAPFTASAPISTASAPMEGNTVCTGTTGTWEPNTGSVVTGPFTPTAIGETVA